jgi:protein transport protein SEC23
MQPVLLSASSVAVDRMLLLDTFFHVLVWSGENIMHWRNAGYHNKPEYAPFKALLEAPVVDAAALRQDRFPAPIYIECDQYSSPARILLALVDPDVTHHSSGGLGGPGGGPAGAGEVILSDDVSLSVFMDHLRKLSVQS